MKPVSNPSSPSSRPPAPSPKTLLFVAEYQADDRRGVGDGGGLAAEGVEDIEVLGGRWRGQAIRDGGIMDAKPLSCCTWR